MQDLGGAAVYGVMLAVSARRLPPLGGGAGGRLEAGAADPMRRSEVAKLSVLMATVFVDMMGFLMVLPLLPFYAEALGADPVVVTLLVAAFALAQLLTAPLLGALLGPARAGGR